MRARLLPGFSLQAAALIAAFGGNAALQAQPSSDLAWDRANTYGHGSQCDVQTWLTGDPGDWTQKGDEIPHQDTAGVQAIHDLSSSAPGADGYGGGGDGGDADGEIYSYAASLSEINPDNQPLLSWSVIHDQLAFADLTGPGGGGGGNGLYGGYGSEFPGSTENRLESAVNCPVVLAVVPMGNPLATTDGTIEVVFGWQDITLLDAEIPGLTGVIWDRYIGCNVTLDDEASMVIQGSGTSSAEVIYWTSGNPNPTVVVGNGFLNGAAGDMYLGRGNCVDLNVAAGANAWIGGNVATEFYAYGNAPGGGGGGGTPNNPGNDGGAGGGAGGGSAGTNGSPGGAGDNVKFDTVGTFQGWIGVFAGW